MSVEQPEPPREAGMVRERLAEYAHEAWTGWMRYLFSRGKFQRNGFVIAGEWVTRWQRQMDTPYARLSPRDQDSDRAEADKMLAIMLGEAPPPQPSAVAPDTPMLHDPGFLCPECGPHVPVDEFLCCRGCGCDTNGRYLIEQAQRLAALESDLARWQLGVKPMPAGPFWRER